MLVLETIETYYVCSWCDLGISATMEGTKAWMDHENMLALHPKCKEKYEKAESERQIFYTICNDRYDSFGTRTEAIVGKTDRGKEVRKVSIMKEHVEWQTARYHSGLGCAWTQKEYDEQVSYGWIMPTLQEVKEEEERCTDQK